MNQGEIIQTIRLLDRERHVQEQRIVTLEKKVAEMDDVLKSPIRRAIYANKGRKQESDQSEHSD